MFRMPVEERTLKVVKYFNTDKVRISLEKKLIGKKVLWVLINTGIEIGTYDSQCKGIDAWFLACERHQGINTTEQKALF